MFDNEIKCEACETPIAVFKPHELCIMNRQLVVICKTCGFIMPVKFDSEGYVIKKEEK